MSNSYIDNHIIPEDFIYLEQIDNSIRPCLRYTTKYNFLGRIVAGYVSNKIIVTKPAAEMLHKVQKELLKDGFSLVVYDAYRPVKACQDFAKWAEDLADTTMQHIFYPSLDKSTIMYSGYVGEKSSHSRGSTVDITIIKSDQAITTPQLHTLHLDNKTIPYYADGTIFMGTAFDYFGKESHTYSELVSPEAKRNRQYLVEKMAKYGFINTAPGWGNDPQEWWHFTLENEPFADQYFNFDVK